MKGIIVKLVGATAILFYCGGASAQPSPHMFGQMSAPECVDAMAIAEHMYASTSTYLYAPLQLPDHLDSTMILGAENVDISGGDAIPEETAHFNNPFPDLEGVHWGKDSSPAGRIVVTSEGVGWRGDMYSLYIIQGGVTPAQFRADLEDANPKHIYPALFDGEWRTPLVFWSGSTKKSWFIIVDDTYESSGQWVVYTAGKVGYTSTCQIKFWPPQGLAKAPLTLPKAVRQFVDLLDQALGNGDGEGTLHPTATLRARSRHMWRNVAYRPWAISDKDAYNSRQQVDDGLLHWSQTGNSYVRLYAQIQHAYPAAESALSKYYESQFKLSRVHAKQVAHWILDVTYRSSFTFSGGSPTFMPGESASPNPWASL
jgi:hypothetical protein